MISCVSNNRLNHLPPQIIKNEANVVAYSFDRRIVKAMFTNRLQYSQLHIVAGNGLIYVIEEIYDDYKLCELCDTLCYAADVDVVRLFIPKHEQLGVEISGKLSTGRLTYLLENELKTAVCNTATSVRNIS